MDTAPKNDHVDSIYDGIKYDNDCPATVDTHTHITNSFLFSQTLVVTLHADAFMLHTILHSTNPKTLPPTNITEVSTRE